MKTKTASSTTAVNPQAIMTFDFRDNPVRTIDRDGQVWFVAADVCRALGIVNSRRALSGLDLDQKASISAMTVRTTDDQTRMTVHSMNGQNRMTVRTTDGQNRMTVGTADGQTGKRGGAQSFNVINESGVYALIFKSRKPEAKAFARWVTNDVLPSIRRTGSYGAQPADPQAVLFERVLTAIHSLTEGLAVIHQRLEIFADIPARVAALEQRMMNPATGFGGEPPRAISPRREPTENDRGLANRLERLLKATVFSGGATRPWEGPPKDLESLLMAKESPVREEAFSLFFATPIRRALEALDVCYPPNRMPRRVSWRFFDGQHVVQIVPLAAYFEVGEE